MCAKTTTTSTHAHAALTSVQARMADMVTHYVTHLMRRQATTTLVSTHDGNGGDVCDGSSDSDYDTSSDDDGSRGVDATTTALAGGGTGASLHASSSQPRRQRRRHAHRCVPPANEQLASFDHFCAEYVPDISVAQYVSRLVTYMYCSSEAYVYALAYLRRLLHRGFPLHAHTIHRLLLTAIVVASKTRDDHCRSARYYAQVGGVTNADLNAMELRFLSDLIDFRAEVLPCEYHAVLRAMLAHSRLRNDADDNAAAAAPAATAAATNVARDADAHATARQRGNSMCDSRGKASDEGATAATAIAASTSSVCGVSAYASLPCDTKTDGDTSTTGSRSSHSRSSHSTSTSSSSGGGGHNNDEGDKDDGRGVLHDVCTSYASAAAAHTVAQQCSVVQWACDNSDGRHDTTPLVGGSCAHCRRACCCAAAAV